MRSSEVLFSVAVLYGFCAIGHGLSLPKANVEYRDDVNFNITGLVAAVFTALNDDYTINEQSVPKYAKILKNNDIEAILVGGSSGEHTRLSVPSRKKHIAAWISAAKEVGLKHVMVQVGGAALSDVLDLARYSARTGADSILVMPASYYIPKKVDELVEHIGLVAKEVPNLPVFYYHVPKHSYVELNIPEFVKAASAVIPNFQGVKATITDLAEILLIKEALGKGQKMFLGGETLLAPAYFMGIDSCISPAVSLFPSLMKEIVASVDNGNWRKAAGLQEKLITIVNGISDNGGRLPGMKAAMAHMYGLAMGPPVLRTKPLTEQNKSNIKKILELL